MEVEPSSDTIDQDACAAIRALLINNGVPKAAFIDDHVAKALVQRNILAECLAGIATNATDEQAREIESAFRRAYPSGVNMRRVGGAVGLYFAEREKR